jgi:hypothetical protein
MLDRTEFGKWFFLIVLSCLILAYFVLVFGLKLPTPFPEPLQRGFALARTLPNIIGGLVGCLGFIRLLCLHEAGLAQVY